MLFGGVASADRDWRHGRDTSHRSGGTVVRDHRHQNYNHNRVYRNNNYRNNNYRNKYYRNDYRNDYRNRARHRVDRRPVYVNNGRFVFHGGISRTYTRPVIHHRYYDYRYRPSIIVENYDPVPGYIWVQGHWSWNGYEWIWTAGYYAPDPNYQYSYDYDYGYGYDYRY